MKKILGAFFIAVFSIVLLGCGKKEFAHDGKFTAFKTSESNGNPQITWVSVTVKDGKVTEFFIDELQSKDGKFNEKTKKELKEDYGMKNASDIDKEWYEQAEVIEKFFLEEGPDKLKLNEEGYIDGLTGATIKGGTYKELALEALENAKNGIYTAFKVNDTKIEVTWVEVHYGKKDVEKFVIDTRQSTENKWNEKTKKELKEDYGMKKASKIDKEWYEQAEAIEQFFLENGPDKLKLDDEGNIDGLSGATIKGGTYKELALEALKLRK